MIRPNSIALEAARRMDMPSMGQPVSGSIAVGINDHSCDVSAREGLSVGQAALDRTGKQSGHIAR
jgi:hypothetical protein